ncbi:inositol-1-monophosphatase [Candidatus Palibaumannia cicadellinicola]|uniref:Inositol-1-monophosphatase n=1 Tax=Baumannia cicadellinicola subsp. Homalodisca coagulata TaxID=374463 RepID=Q1LU80_BAUCH|nr:inositol-1-monophosphatase [Candidatus Baumannia cicadellinicola]ABF13949.1 inositol-1-monophosphatase [Baumannia cicadellinicola str. Hc (Homalodisca coagulata)]MCJ7461993.1 inositol-1-monophosphatase [Candidatus Baumannia cicadellinicola]MCJ7463091.1 inositol-1-monophosphatase [Candidatus Baumannia cicadellinicola]
MHPMLNIAIRGARKAGDFLAKHFDTNDAIDVSNQSNQNIINYINHEAERLITEVIHKYYPQHAVINANNRELSGIDRDIQWINNIIDNSTNFMKRIPNIAVSVALRIKERTELAVIYDPMRNELFSAIRGHGAQMNGYRLRSSTIRDLESTILAINFPFQKKQNTTKYIVILNQLLLQCLDFRCTGSIALDFAYLAAGKVDGLFEIGLKQSNIISGELLVRESGGLVTDFNGGNNHLFSGNIIAGNPRIVKSMLSLIREHFSNIINSF